VATTHLVVGGLTMSKTSSGPRPSTSVQPAPTARRGPRRTRPLDRIPVRRPVLGRGHSEPGPVLERTPGTPNPRCADPARRPRSPSGAEVSPACGDLVRGSCGAEGRGTVHGAPAVPGLLPTPMRWSRVRTREAKARSEESTSVRWCASWRDSRGDPRAELAIQWDVAHETAL